MSKQDAPENTSSSDLTPTFWQYLKRDMKIFLPTLVRDTKIFLLALVSDILSIWSTKEYSRSEALLSKIRAVVVFWCSALLALLCYTPYVRSDSGICRPDNKFDISGKAYNVWRPTNPFEVTLSSGDFGFGVAKLIDVLWDVVFGRGGQAALAYIFYKTFTQFLLVEMTMSSVSVLSYKSVFLETEPTIWSTIQLLRGFIRYKALDSKLGMCWMAFSAALIISFPTLSAAMTSYTQRTLPYVRSSEGNMLSALNRTQILYVLHDSREVPGFSAERPLYITTDFDTSQLNNVSEYVAVYGFFGENNTDSTLGSTNFTAPSLDIGGYYFGQYEARFYGSKWQDSNGNLPYNDPKNSAYFVGDELFLNVDLNSIGSCTPQATYRWGFSFLLLWVMTLLVLVWSIGTFVIWHYSFTEIRIRKRHGVPGQFKAILNVARTLKKGLEEHGQDLEFMTEQQVEKHLRYTMRGGSMVYEDVQCAEKSSNNSIEYIPSREFGSK